MRLKILKIGKTKNRHCEALAKDYLERLRYPWQAEVVALKDANDSGADAERILQALQGDTGLKLALSEEGQSLSSRKLAQRLAGGTEAACTLVIGGPDGLHDSVKAACGGVLSLSKLTLPHDLAYVVLAEQLFRAYSIATNSKYHRD